MSGWQRIWAGRELPPAQASTLGHLLAADGFESGFAGMTEEAWLEGVRHVAEALRLSPGDSVFEVGSGAGAYLLDMDRAGVQVSGIDLSPVLVEKAREVLPNGSFAVDSADTFPTEPQADAVISFGVFFYFPTHAYVDAVIDRMVAKARRSVAILDLPDLATKEADLARRTELAGGAEAYAERYAGLDHLYFDRGELVEGLEARGLVDVTVEQQCIPGYGNGPFRFNVWGFLPE